MLPMQRWWHLNHAPLRSISRWLGSGKISSSNRAGARWLSAKEKNTTKSSHHILKVIPDSKIPNLFKGPLKRFERIGLSIIAVYLGLHVFWEYFYSFDPTYGISMMPTISSFGDCVILSKRYRRGRGVRVGDLVSFRHPVHEGEDAVKRIIGLGGDFVLMNTPGKNDAMIQVPQGHCWVVGDNLAHSRDSRMFGPLPLALVKGKVLAIVKFDYWRLPSFIWLGQGLQQAYIDDEIE